MHRKLQDFQFGWYPKGTRIESAQQVQIFDNVKTPGGTVVIITEHPGNQGRSVTNGIEQIASELILQQGLSPFTTVWVEHYHRAPGDSEPDSYDVVTFDVDRNRTELRNPQWKTIEWDGVAELIGAEGDWDEL